MSHTNCTRPDSNIGCKDCVAYSAEEEQARIIKLLDESYLSDKGKAHLIALIKGENK